MSHDDDTSADREQERVDRGKAAAQEAIGKLIGDDAQVRKGQAAREGTEPPADQHDE